MRAQAELPHLLLGQYNREVEDVGNSFRGLAQGVTSSSVQTVDLIPLRSTVTGEPHSDHSQALRSHSYSTGSSSPSTLALAFTGNGFPLGSPGGQACDVPLSLFKSCCRCSIAQSCLTLCDPMDCSTPGFPVCHHLPELAQIHVLQVSDAIQPSHPLSSPSPPAFNLSQHQGFFQ